MDISSLETLARQGLIREEVVPVAKAQQEKALFSLHWEISVLLYLGVLLLSGGLGILIYKNIDTIGHQAILALIAAISGGCFYYCFKKVAPFSTSKVESPNALFDYVLLLGSLTLLSFVAYLQFQYQVFGTRYGLATFIPMVLMFITAYRFDHLGLLSIAITNLAAWVGIAVTPAALLTDNDFNDATLIYSGLALGIVLIAAGVLSGIRHIKPHFSFTYRNFGVHVLFVACLAGMFHFDATYALWFLFLAGIAAFVFRMAMKEHSFYFILITVLYGYVGLSYTFIRFLFESGGSGNEEGKIYLAIFYFIASAVGLIFTLIHFNRKLKENAGL